MCEYYSVNLRVPLKNRKNRCSVCIHPNVRALFLYVFRHHTNRAKYRFVQFGKMGLTNGITTFDIVGIFIVMIAGFAGSLLPFVAHDTITVYARATGAGVVLAVAMVHVAPDAYSFLGDPSVSSIIPNNAPSIAGVVMLGIILALHTVELFGLRFIERRINIEPIEGCDDMEIGLHQQHQQHQLHQQHRHNSHYSESNEQHMHVHTGTALAVITSCSSMRDCYSLLLLEMSVAIHSIIIGVDLGLEGGSKGLVIALCFHQALEGLAISAAIIDAGTKKIWRIWSIVLFSLTLPIGGAIGLGIRAAIGNINNPTGLITRGILNAAAAGVLTYVSIADMLTGWFSRNRKFRGADMRHVCLVETLLYTGAAVMTVLAIWA